MGFAWKFSSLVTKLLEKTFALVSFLKLFTLLRLFFFFQRSCVYYPILTFFKVTWVSVIPHSDSTSLYVNPMFTESMNTIYHMTLSQYHGLHSPHCTFHPCHLFIPYLEACTSHSLWLFILNISLFLRLHYHIFLNSIIFSNSLILHTLCFCMLLFSSPFHVFSPLFYFPGSSYCHLRLYF